MAEVFLEGNVENEDADDSPGYKLNSLCSSSQILKTKNREIRTAGRIDLPAVA
jgi:hypothetical protein